VVPFLEAFFILSVKGNVGDQPESIDNGIDELIQPN
jgi:hypothetical protein